MSEITRIEISFQYQQINNELKNYFRFHFIFVWKLLFEWFFNSKLIIIFSENHSINVRYHSNKLNKNQKIEYKWDEWVFYAFYEFRKCIIYHILNAYFRYFSDIMILYIS
jgi:hypothetical protein